MRDAFMSELLTQARQDPMLMLLVGDLGFGVVEAFASELPEQFLNVGVAEQNMIGVAAGLASGGFKVFVYSIANFPTFRCLEQIRNDVCYHHLDVTIVSVGAGVSYGTLGYTHHAVEDISIMRSLPGIRILSPADPTEARMAVKEVLSKHGPSYIRLAKNGEPVLHASDTLKGLGEPLILREGKDITIIATGSVVAECLAAAELLEARGVAVEVVSCPTIKPLSQRWLSTLATKRLLTVEEHTLAGGFGSAILEGLNELGYQVRLRRVGLRESQLSELGSAPYLRQVHGLSPASIVREVLMDITQ